MGKTLAAVLVVAAVVVSLAWCEAAQAGGGPENVVVVVNTQSWASLSVANEYIRQRGIAPSHVIALDLPLARTEQITDVDTFREKILKPVLAAIKDRGLSDVVNCVAYSADIPTGIDFSKDSGAPGSIGSINGLTFLYEMVLAKQQYWNLDVNEYFRKASPMAGADPTAQRFIVQPSMGFRAWSADNKSPKHMLSTVLGVISSRGTSVPEGMAALGRAASADGTNPKGTFYYMFDGCIRTNTRKPWFASAIATLQSMGQKAKEINDKGPFTVDVAVAMPTKVDDIIGAMLGQQYPNPERSQSKALPGALIDNLTSEGGIMAWNGGQVPITTFIGFGAAGASGTVTEPYAIWQKFASPFLFVHYAAGCSLAEAYYQSVSGPYQLLIIGDPLCRPFAKIPATSVVDLKPMQVVPETWSPKNVKLATSKTEGKAGLTLQSLVDGRPLDGKPLTPGYHEFMAVATVKDDIATQGWQAVPFIVKEAPQFTISGDKTVELGKSVKLSAAAAGAKKIDILHCGRVIKTIDGAKGDCEIPTSLLGVGPIRLDAVADINGKAVAAVPLMFEVTAPKPLPAQAIKIPDGQELQNGPTLTSPGVKPYNVLDMRRRQALQEAKVPAGAEYKIEAYFEVPADDLCQFQVWTDGTVTLKIDGQTLPPCTQKGWTFLPISLAKGKHTFVATGKAGPARELEIRFGPPGTRRIGARCHGWETDHIAMHFSHLAPKAK